MQIYANFMQILCKFYANFVLKFLKNEKIVCYKFI